MLNAEKIIAKAQKWLETEHDEEDIEDVQRLISQIERTDEGPRKQMRLDNLNNHVKGTSMRITLNEEQQAHSAHIVGVLNTIFTELPELSMPRIHTVEAFTEKVESAFKAQIKAALK